MFKLASEEHFESDQPLIKIFTSYYYIKRYNTIQYSIYLTVKKEKGNEGEAEITALKH